MKNQQWYQSLNRSPLTPPSWVFGVVWPILYLAMFTAALRVLKSDKCKMSTRLICLPITIFIIHLIFNFSWTYLFFTMKRPDLALLDITVMTSMVALLTHTFWRYDKIAAVMMFPYLIWSLFATYLNMFIVFKN